jgi:hypothetical protein
MNYRKGELQAFVLVEKLKIQDFIYGRERQNRNIN